VEASFRVAFTHTSTATAATLDTTQNAIKVTSTTPFLMCENIATKFALTTLNQIHVCKHAIGLEALGELVGNRGSTVQTSQRDELKNESVNMLAIVEIVDRCSYDHSPFLAQIPDEAL